MKLLKEITKWEGDYVVPNHTYAINDAGKLVAYKMEGTNEWLAFEKPRMFSRSYRKFITLKHDKESLEFFERLGQ